MMARIGWVILIGLVLAWVAGALIVNFVDLSAPLATRHECPHDWNPKEHQAGVTLSEAGPIASIPEFHDCQRFIVLDANQRPVYDSLYAIYASFTLPTLSRRLDSLDSIADHPGSLGLPAAQIWTDNGKDPRLGITTILSCLYLFHGPRWPKVEEWRARVTPGNETRGTCAPTLSSSEDRGAPLQVRPTSFPDRHLTDQDYPPVARWDWDSVHHQQYIGIKCGAAWCEVGPDGFAPSAPYLPPSGMSPKEQRVYLVKGWYDEQFLSPAGGSHDANPTTIKGTIIPDPKLGDYTTPAEFAGKWIRVAEVMLSQSAPDYKRKFNFDAGHLFQRTNTIYLCYGTRLECFGARTFIFWWAYPTCKNGKGWWERTVAVDGRIMHTCEVRRPNTDPTLDRGDAPTVPGTTRWRWQANDETTWKRCLQGCCEPA